MEDFEILLRGEVAVERSSRWWKYFCIYIGFVLSRDNKPQFRSRVYNFTYYLHKLLDSRPLLKRGGVGFEGHL
jgi:hypothetical protein